MSSAVRKCFLLVFVLVRTSGVMGVDGGDGTKPVRSCSPGGRWPPPARDGDSGRALVHFHKHRNVAYSYGQVMVAVGTELSEQCAFLLSSLQLHYKCF